MHRGKQDFVKTSPYSIYDRFDFKMLHVEQGSVSGYEFRLEEIEESLKILEQALSNSRRRRL